MNVLRPLGSTGLQCHWLGFGCYRVQYGDSEHAAALRAYLEQGGNLIDTSANYGDGGSEELAGEILAEFPREQVVVVTKGGYIQGQNMALALERNFPETVQYGPGIWHSIHPEFLAEQIDRSCARLKQNFVDVYLLHNPEYFLEDVAHRREITAADHDEFYRRIREAFRFLETQVASGRIRWYGVSSNNFVRPAATPTATSVARCWREAQSLSKDHHFRVVQFPLNLFEAGAALHRDDEGQSPLEFCRSHGLGTLANRPLNAFRENELIRLADWSRPGAALPGIDGLSRDLQPLAAHEQSFQSWAGEPVHLASGGGVTELLLGVVPHLTSMSHWEQVAARHVIQPIQAWMTQAHERHQQNPQWPAWRDEFIDAINHALQAIRRHIAAGQQGISDRVRDKLRAAGYASDDRPLSRLALDVLGELQGLSCVLVGMRRREYVEDAMAAGASKAFDSVAVLEKFNSLNT